MTWTSLSLPVVRTSRALPTGIISAAEAPWKMRAATNWPSVCVRPHSSEVTVKHSTEIAKMRLAPNRSASQALAGRHTAWASR